MSVSEDVNIEAYRQAFETLRHYGNLRFAVLTAFIAISGGLFAIALKKPREDKARFWFPCIAGVVIALAFTFLEWRINQLMTFFADKSFELATQLKMSAAAAEKPPTTAASYLSGLVAMETVYIGSIIMWIVAAILYRRKKL
jgi:hypothetical protein